MTEEGGDENSMGVRETARYREDYDNIVIYFETLKTPGIDQMILPIDTAEQVSLGAYEHYRVLQGMFHMRLKEMLVEGTPGPREWLACTIQKRCSTSTLPRERYKSYLD